MCSYWYRNLRTLLQTLIGNLTFWYLLQNSIEHCLEVITTGDKLDPQLPPISLKIITYNVWDLLLHVSTRDYY